MKLAASPFQARRLHIAVVIVLTLRCHAVATRAALVHHRLEPQGISCVQVGVMHADVVELLGPRRERSRLSSRSTDEHSAVGAQRALVAASRR